MGRLSEPSGGNNLILSSVDRTTARNNAAGMGPNASHVVLLGEGAGQNLLGSDLVAFGQLVAGGNGAGWGRLGSPFSLHSVIIGTRSGQNLEGDTAYDLQIVGPDIQPRNTSRRSIIFGQAIGGNFFAPVGSIIAAPGGSNPTCSSSQTRCIYMHAMDDYTNMDAQANSITLKAGELPVASSLAGGIVLTTPTASLNIPAGTRNFTIQQGDIAFLRAVNTATGGQTQFGYTGDFIGIGRIGGATCDNAAGALAATLNNSPRLGDPTKWLYFNDNGLRLAIPAWQAP